MVRGKKQIENTNKGKQTSNEEITVPTSSKDVKGNKAIEYSENDEKNVTDTDLKTNCNSDIIETNTHVIESTVTEEETLNSEEILNKTVINDTAENSVKDNIDTKKDESDSSKELKTVEKATRKPRYYEEVYGCNWLGQCFDY